MEASAETEVAPEKVAPTPSPEPAAEEPAAEQEPEEDFGSLLAELDSDAATPEGDGKRGAADTETPETGKALTEAEIRADERRKLEAQSRDGQTAEQRRAYVQSVRQSFQLMDTNLTSALRDLGISDVDSVDRVKRIVQQHNGHWNTLYQEDVGAARGVGQDEVKQGVHMGTAALLGEDGAMALVQANHQTWDAHLSAFAEAYAKKKGMASKAEVKDAETAAQTRILKKIDAALKEKGMSLAQITGNANPSLPAIGGNGRSSNKRYADMTGEERSRLTPEQRDALTARDAGRSI